MKIKLRKLGGREQWITPIGLGAQTIGGLGYGDQDQQHSPSIVEAYLKGGGRLIDVARGYGTSEIHVGNAIKACHLEEEVFLCSKTGSLHPPVAASDLDVSRFCLQRDWIDLYYVHVPSRDPLQHNRILDTFQSFKERGLIRFTGLSCRNVNDPAHRDEVLGWIQDPRVDVIQIPCNPSHPPEVLDLIAEAADHGIGVICRGTVQGGLFNESFCPEQTFEDRENDWKAQVEPADMQQALHIVRDVAEELRQEPYQTLAQLTQSWTLNQAGVSAIIGGAGSLSEVNDLLAVAEMLPPDQHTSTRLREKMAPIQALIKRLRKEG